MHLLLCLLVLSHLPLSGGVQSGIFGGGMAKPHSRPYMASLQTGGHHVCGGVLIRDDYILTAAHCYKLKPQEVVLGGHNITQRESSQQRIQLEEKDFHTHPQFKHPNQFHFDIMLLKLKPKAELNEYVQVLELPRRLGRIPARLHCEVAGWGRRVLGRGAESVLFEANVTLASSKDCRNIAGNHFSVDQMSCSFSKGVDGFCQGDSGGPLVCRHNNKHILYGVDVYTGSPCDTPDYPQVYTSVAYFLPWIKEELHGKNYGNHNVTKETIM
ncbi:mast cell protease 1A-like [Alosa pseudoharengus]|uniref:mast cell protease 1A-like n=1 Tax=Alosa pseudoharengus TaxID=34774 RepID=UPI003F892773